MREWKWVASIWQMWEAKFRAARPKNTMRLILPFLLARKTKLLRLVAIGLGQAATTVGISLIIRDVFDSVGSHRGHRPSLFAEPAHFWTLCTLLFFAIGARALLIFDQRSQGEALGQQFAHDTRLKVFTFVSKISPAEFQKRSKTNVILRLSNDLTPLRQWITNGLARSTAASVSIIATVAVLAIIDRYVALVVCMAIASGIFVAYLLKAPFQNTLMEARKKRGELASSIGERVTNMPTILASRQMSRESRLVAERSQSVVDLMVKRGRYIGILRAWGEGVSGVAMGCALIIGAWQVTRGVFTTGTLAAIISIVRLMSGQFRDLERAYEYWFGARVSKRSLERLLSLRVLSQPESDQNAVPAGGDLSLQGVAVQGRLSEFSAEASAGEKIAIVGAPGSGKSTLFMLIVGLLEMDSGTIRLGGADLTRIPRKLLPDFIGIVSAEVPLLRGSMRKNVAYRKPKATESELSEAFELSGLNRLLGRLPEGLDTRLSERGTNLSVTERQCIALARALLGKPPLLLIDESSLVADVETSGIIRALMSGYPGTILLITYDGELAATATRTWTLSGTPQCSESSSSTNDTYGELV